MFKNLLESLKYKNESYLLNNSVYLIVTMAINTVQ